VWKLARLNFPQAVYILDYYHACEHLNLLSATLYGEGSVLCQRWRERDTKPADRNGSGVLAGGMKKAGGFFHRPALFVTFRG
jgi:hypothetical protein